MESSGPKRDNKTRPEQTDHGVYAGLSVTPTHSIDDPITHKEGQRFPRQKCIAVDVDETLIVGGKVNTELVTWCKEQKKKGFFMILWSARGMYNAKLAAVRSGIEFDAIIPKPGHIVDDLGWSWTGYTQEIEFL